jgi:acyl carrier protein
VPVFHNGHVDSGLPASNSGNGCANGGVRYNVQYTLRDQTQHSGPLADSSLSADRFERDTIDILKRLSRKPIEPALTSALLADLGFDSLQVLELIGELEDHFNIAVPLNALTHIRTVGEIVAEVRRLVHVQESQS